MYLEEKANFDRLNPPEEPGPSSRSKTRQPSKSVKDPKGKGNRSGFAALASITASRTTTENDEEIKEEEDDDSSDKSKESDSSDRGRPPRPGSLALTPFDGVDSKALRRFSFSDEEDEDNNSNDGNSNDEIYDDNNDAIGGVPLEDEEDIPVDDEDVPAIVDDDNDNDNSDNNDNDNETVHEPTAKGAMDEGPDTPKDIAMSADDEHVPQAAVTEDVPAVGTTSSKPAADASDDPVAMEVDRLLAGAAVLIANEPENSLEDIAPTA